MDTADQLRVLANYTRSFADSISECINHDGRLTAFSLRTFQINVGKRCNQACVHCHVDASPIRTEMMDRETVDLCLKVIREVREIETVDITGGAPEMNENFTYLVTESRKLGKHVIDRCNLTILEHPDYPYLYDFLREHGVEIVASLPHFARSNTDRQRGAGVFDTSITALKKLNERGYGFTLPLNLVYNPVGLYLSAPQTQLEREFKEYLGRRHRVTFNKLYCINNLPINRFLVTLVKHGRFDSYMDILANAFNPDTIDGLMCRRQISVGYDGQVYDCDFNQMLDLPAAGCGHIRTFHLDTFLARRVRTANHCFGCSAGTGSSCGGAITGK